MQHLVNLIQEGDLISISINAFSPIRTELGSTRTAILWEHEDVLSSRSQGMLSTYAEDSGMRSQTRSIQMYLLIYTMFTSAAEVEGSAPTQPRCATSWL